MRRPVTAKADLRTSSALKHCECCGGSALHGHRAVTEDGVLGTWWAGLEDKRYCPAFCAARVEIRQTLHSKGECLVITLCPEGVRTYNHCLLIEVEISSRVVTHVWIGKGKSPHLLLYQAVASCFDTVRASWRSLRRVVL